MAEQARDVSALFAALNITESYREFQPGESASHALDRWPLLRSLEPTVEPEPVDSPSSLREFLFGGAPAASHPAEEAASGRTTARPFTLDAEHMRQEQVRQQLNRQEQSRLDQARSDQPRLDQSRLDQSRQEQARQEPSRPAEPVPLLRSVGSVLEPSFRGERDTIVAMVRPLVSRGDERRQAIDPMFAYAPKPAAPPAPAPVAPPAPASSATERALDNLFARMTDNAEPPPRTAPTPERRIEAVEQAALENLFKRLG